MARQRSAKDYRKAIAALLEEAEASAKENFEEKEAPLSEAEVDTYLRGLDVTISQEAMIALRAEFLRYSSVFDTEKTQENIRTAVAEVTRPLIEAWLNNHMSEITREVITEALGKIAGSRHDE